MDKIRFDCKCNDINCLKCQGNRFIEKAVAEEKKNLQVEFNSKILFGIMTVLDTDDIQSPGMQIRVERMEGGWETIGRVNVDEWVKRRDRYLRSVGKVAEPGAELLGL
jgi:hypothetical protein